MEVEEPEAEEAEPEADPEEPEALAVVEAGVTVPKPLTPAADKTELQEPAVEADLREAEPLKSQAEE